MSEQISRMIKCIDATIIGQFLNIPKNNYVISIPTLLITIFSVPLDVLKYV